MTRIGDPNSWYPEHALRLLAERAGDPKTAPAADAPGFCGDRTEPHRLRYLWAQYAANGGTLPPAARAAGFDDAEPAVRGWTVRLISEEPTPVSSEALAKFLKLAESDPSPVVRLEIASALQRLPLADRWPIVAALAAHGEDADDVNLPVMVWYAFEPMAAQDPARALQLAAGAKQPKLLPFAVRRIAAVGSPEALAAIVATLRDATGSGARRAILGALDQALKGRTRVAMPAGWAELSPTLVAYADAEVRSRTLAVGLTFGDPASLAALRNVLADARGALAARREALAALLKARDAAAVPALRALATAEGDLRGEAIRGLAAFDDPATPEALLGAYPGLPPTNRRDALGTLASRPAFARALLDAVGSGRVARTDLTADVVRQLRNLKDPAVDARVAEVWGVARESTADRVRLIADAKAKWSARPSKAPDARLGRAVFEKTCAQCHNLFGTGGDVGPELTGSNRADLDYLLGNVYDPSALIGRDYQATVVATKDGRVLTGIVRAEDKDAITLRTAGETLVLPKDQVEERKLSDASMMPEGIWDPLSEHEVRSLISYLASPAQVPPPSPNP